MIVRDLGLVSYRDAWAEQERVHADVVAGAGEQVLLVEHPPVVTLGRRPDVARNLLVSPDELARRGVELVETDRGGDVTFHGPGQVVAYPVVRLIDHRLSVGAYVHRLEDAVVAALRDRGIEGHRDACAVGVWVARDAQPAAKVAAIGVRVRRGVTMHGLALNVTIDLSFFDLIIPCGLTGRHVTSVQQLLAPRAVRVDDVKASLVARLVEAFAASRQIVV